MPRPLKFDMVFLDHLKPLYTIDLKVMEEEGLVGPVCFPCSLVSFTYGP
jgi:catechol O-methyltransferase